MKLTFRVGYSEVVGTHILASCRPFVGRFRGITPVHNLFLRVLHTCKVSNERTCNSDPNQDSRTRRSWTSHAKPIVTSPNAHTAAKTLLSRNPAHLFSLWTCQLLFWYCSGHQCLHRSWHTFSVVSYRGNLTSNNSEEGKTSVPELENR